MDDAADLHWMRRALTLAAQGVGHTSPNPAVGAVIVRDNQVLGEGFHRRAGLPHAEIEALDAARQAGHDPSGATIYVTLEPCCHQGRTGPCTQALIKAGIGRVVFAQADPNPLVAGRGQAELVAAHIPTVAGLLADEARLLNAPFNKWIVTRRPFLTLKLAQSLDGRIARIKNERTAVTGPEANARTMALRARHDLVLVGANTARIDDPRLTVRDATGQPAERQPRRGFIDTSLSLVGLSLLASPGALVVTTVPLEDPRARALSDAGVTVVRVPQKDGRVDLAAALTALGALPEPVTSVLVEGGGELAASLMAHGLVDRLVVLVAPRVFGATGVPSFGPLDAVHELTLSSVERVGADLELTFEPGPRTQDPHEGA